MAILVTGGLGLLGRRVLDLLVGAGRAALSYDRAMPPPDPIPGVTYVTGDLNDYPHLVETAQRHGIEAIVHTAAASGPMVRAEAPYEVCQWNVMGTVAVYEVARLLGMRRVVYCSSTAVYGHTGAGLVGEERALHPLSVYGATKAAGELLGASYGVQFGLDFVALRLGHVFGPRRTTQDHVREMVRAALDGRALADGAPRLQRCPGPQLYTARDCGGDRGDRPGRTPGVRTRYAACRRSTGSTRPDPGAGGATLCPGVHPGCGPA